jgi:hypothetical protein
VVNLLIVLDRHAWGREATVAALAWLLIPVVAAIAAAVWGSWAARTRATGDGASLADYERFREAMRKSDTASR